MRPIDADALKKDLTRFYYGEVTARELIDEQPTVGGWISVKDQKPKAIESVNNRYDYKPVMLYAPNNDSYYIGWYVCKEEYSGRDLYISRTSLYAYQVITKKITHWKPLPMPPME